MCLTCGGDSEQASQATNMPQPDQGQNIQALLNSLSRYSIQSLTINSYGPLTILSDKPDMRGGSHGAPKATFQHDSAKSEDDLMPQWSWATADVRLRNDLQGFLRRVTIRHKRGYSAGVVTEKTWENVASGNTTDVFSTDFQEGLGSDYDYWQIELQIEDGGPVFRNDGWKQCNLRAADKNDKGPIDFQVEGENFNIRLRSGGDTTSLRAGSPGLNGFAWMQIENSFTTTASDVNLRHNHEGYPSRTGHWDGPVPKGQSTSSWPVYFKTGDPSNDLWDISIMREGDRKPHVNWTKPKGCWLQGPDNGRIVKIIVRDSGWTTAFPSGGCDDYWDWKPNAQRVSEVTEAVDDDWTSDI